MKNSQNRAIVRARCLTPQTSKSRSEQYRDFDVVLIYAEMKWKLLIILEVFRFLLRRIEHFIPKNWVAKRSRSWVYTIMYPNPHSLKLDMPSRITFEPSTKCLLIISLFLGTLMKFSNLRRLRGIFSFLKYFDFTTMIDDYFLMNLGAVSHCFTWYRRQTGSSMAKHLDRALCEQAWVTYKDFEDVAKQAWRRSTPSFPNREVATKEDAISSTRMSSRIVLEENIKSKPS
ncbi:hypothetical protein CR513_10856, partial [Mucuna pruriens]